MYIPIRRWEFEAAAHVIRTNLRIDQAADKVSPISNLTRGIAWRIAQRLSGEKLYF